MVVTNAIVSFGAFAFLYWSAKIVLDLLWMILGPSYVYLMLEAQHDE
jgi:hypothetical protein